MKGSRNADGGSVRIGALECSDLSWLSQIKQAKDWLEKVDDTLKFTETVIKSPNIAFQL